MRRLLLILTIFSCATIVAQENIHIRPESEQYTQTVRTMTIHRHDGRQIQYAVASVDTMYLTARGDTLTFRTHDGNRCHIAMSDIDSLTFVMCDASMIHDAVDLGLSALWATCNVGATMPEGLGELYAWGEIQPKDDYAEDRYLYFGNSGYEYIGVNICATRYDVARQTWGDQWRLPNRSEIRELQSLCTWTPETRNGIAGYRVTGPNGNYIFLPSAGYQSGTERNECGTCGFYWTGSLDRVTPSAAYNLNFRGYDAEWTASRAYGMSVRPVK